MLESGKIFPGKAVVVGLVTVLMLCSIIFLTLPADNPAKDQIPEDRAIKETSNGGIPVDRRTTRADNPYTSVHAHPINATDDDGFNPDHINVNEDAPGDGVYEDTGKDSVYAWIECSYNPLNIPAGSIIHNLTLYMGYYNDAEWNISAPHTGIIWSSTSGGIECDIGNYSISFTDRDEVYVVTSGLPTASELNNGIFIRVSGYDFNGQNDVLHLDYLYFTVNYSVPNIVINEVMFDPPGPDDNSEWVELYNAGAFSVDLTGWALADNHGNSLPLTGAGSLSPGGYLVCHIAQAGINSTTDFYGVIETVIDIQPNATDGKDTYIKDTDPLINFGSQPNVIVENTTTTRNILIQFNISNLPSGETITSTKVCLYRFSGNDNDATVGVYRITQDWTESGATWNTTDGTNNWTTAGGDFQGTSWDSINITGDALDWYSWDITDMARGWKNGTYDNYGMLFESTGGSVWKGMYSSDYIDDKNLTPKLVVRYNTNLSSLLNSSDGLSLLEYNGNIVDYVAWGADAGAGDDDAVLAGHWDDGDFIDTSLLLEGQTLGRDKNSNDSDKPDDWQNATGKADPFGADRGDVYGPSPGVANIESVPGAPTITGVSSNPPAQYTGGYVNITCDVTDLDGVYGVWVNITTPGGGSLNTSMTQGFGGQWYYNGIYITTGIYQYIVWANNTYGNWSSSSVYGFTISDAYPSLSDFTVTPLSGYIDSFFNFSVSYSHPLNRAPDTITLNLTGPSGGIMGLSEVDSSDTDFTDGKLYYCNGSGLAMGSYSFHFASNDTDGLWFETIETFSPSVSNRIPSLASPQVSPSVGYIDTGFNFSVTYIDLDNHEPSAITVNVTGLGIYDLSEVDAMDADYANGKSYYLNISGVPLGTMYTFHFAANDSVGGWAEGTEMDGPDVINRGPVLSWDQVQPFTGYNGTYFNFTVTYMDEDNHAPDSISLILTGPSGGVFNLEEVDNSDTDYSDGKLYYCNLIGLTPGTYSFHYSANDAMGYWALDTTEIDAPVVLQLTATLTALDESVDYSDVAYLNATLFQNGTPVPGEDIAIYIDINDNGIFEPEEHIGDGATLPDGIASVTYTPYLVPGTYNFTAKYIGSGVYNVADSRAQLTVNAKPATLTAQSRIAEEYEVIFLNATLSDDNGDPVQGQGVQVYLDKNRNGIYEGGELVGSVTTDHGGTAPVPYTVNIIPGSYDVWARYVGSGNYSVTEIQGLLVVQNTANTPPAILGVVPDQIKPEDSQPWELDLTSYEADIEDSGADLKWYITGIDTSLYSVTGHNSTDDVFTFIPVENAFGSDEITLWLVDSSGDCTSQTIMVEITPVNDLPYFDPLPPNIVVHYDDPESDEDDPEPWNYTFYVHDIETSLDDLVLVTSEPTADSGDGYAEVNGLDVTFHYPHGMLGESILVTLTLYDGTDSAQTVILVNVTTDWVPELVINLPDVTIEENKTAFNVFDLDDYFTDRDHDSLFFSSGYFHLTVVINEDNTVDITPHGQWTGSELVTFRATDPSGAIVEDTITVVVVPVNDGPLISGAPDLVVHYDYSYGFDFSPYIHDPDNSLSDLILHTSAPTDNIWIQQSNNLGVVVNYPRSMMGMSIPVTIYISDGIETASQEIRITVTDDFPPELLYKIPDVSFDEDTTLENYLLLSYYFLDPDGDALYFTNGTKSINAVIDSNLTVDFSAPPNWHGYEFITFRATDPTGAIAEDKILVVVVPVNDAPTIATIPRQVRNAGDQWVLDLTGFIDDVDNDLSELEITVESEVGQGYVALVGNILVFQYPKGVHNDIVTVTVSDGELETSETFTIILQSSAPVAPSIWDMIPWPWIFLVSFAAVSGAFAFYAKKRQYRVYEAFLIHEKGIPIAHASQEDGSELEDVVVSGMFTAVQDFISDTFSGKTHDDDWKLDEMKFGDNKIMIERTENLYLAAIFGGNGKRLGSRMRRLLGDIDGRYGELLKDWDGDMARLAGINTAITALVSRNPSKNAVSEGTDKTETSLTDGEEIRDTLTENGDMEAPSVVEEGEPGTGGEEVYECPECYSEVRSGDIRCPICGVEFSEAVDADTAFSENEKGNGNNGDTDDKEIGGDEP